MSAEVLREAATEMRRNATNATPGRWKLWGMVVMADQDGSSNVDRAVGVAQTYYRDENDKPRTWDASHIIGMQPEVAIAVADWLEQMARAMVGTSYGDLPFEDSATAVANAYLGRSA